MRAELRAHDIAITLGTFDVLNGVSLALPPGHRVGIVGPNGVGKSTLLRVLAGLLEPSRGEVTLSPRMATVGYLPQEPDRREGETVLDFLTRRTGVGAASAALEKATSELSAGVPGSDDLYSDALERWLELGGGDLDSRAAEMLESLGIGAKLADRPTTVLSGGQAARVSLAGILLSRFDVLLLDEPTNDLDFDGLARLETFVTGLRSATAIVSHDRAFLERVITDVVELDDHTRTAAHFAGGWRAYLDNRAVADLHAEQHFSVYTDKRDGLQARAQKQRLWSNQGVAKAKSDNDEKDKHIKNRRIAASEKQASKARATEKAIERLEVVEKPWKEWDLRMVIAETNQGGAVVARFHGVVVRRGAFTLGPVDLEIRRGDRVAIVGPNGAGKSTLLDLLLERLEPDEGTRWLGPGVVMGELEQRRTRFAGEMSLLDSFCDASQLLPQEARTLLAKFGIGAEHVGRDAASLSPGERTRTSLALFQARGVNALILDEPTNHLDLPAIEQLESALNHFKGTVCLVSHDRTLLESFAPTRTLRVVDGVVSEA